jgi:hypothetical protein
MARQSKGLCPNCGKKGLGHTFPSVSGPYRQCTYCGHAVRVDAAAGADAVQALRMLGSCRDGAERDAGQHFHAVPRSSSRALCGKRPGRRSAGWAAHETQVGKISDISCPRCRQALGPAQATANA